MNKHISIERVAGSVYIGESPECSINAAINELLNILASKPFVFSDLKRRPSATTVVKIKYNNIGAKSHIIKQYLDRSSVVESAFSEINSIIPFGKDIIFYSLNGLYFSALDELGIDYLTNDVDIEKIRVNSEYILDSIIGKLRLAVFEAKNAPNIKEHIDAGVNSVVAHAFIECIILENPCNDSALGV